MDGQDLRSALVSLDGDDRVSFDRSLSVGRHPLNDMILGHARISSRHAVIEWQASVWRIRDLGSRNGTSVNGRRIQQWRRLKTGDVLRFAGVSAWRVDCLAEPQQLGGAIAMVELADSARRLPVRSDRFLVGTAAPCDLRVPEWLPQPATPIRLVLFEEAGALRLEPAAGIPGIALEGRPWTDGAVDLDRRLEVALGPSRLALLPVRGSLDPTERAVRQPKSYDLHLALRFTAPSEGEIRVRHPQGEFRLQTGQRFLLLYLLGQAAGRWLDDEQLKLGLWGRAGASEVDRSALHKLIYDTRQLFIARGLDGWFIEKLRGRTRLRLPPERVEVEEYGERS